MVKTCLRNDAAIAFLLDKKNAQKLEEAVLVIVAPGFTRHAAYMRKSPLTSNLRMTPMDAPEVEV